MTNLEIRPAVTADFEIATALLADSNLPVDDLDARFLEGFLTATVGDKIAGFIGLENYGDVGLLRSLVVNPELRSVGLGRVLVAAVESYARDRGVSELWLLTIDADRWFAKLDYAARERDEAPQSIQQTREFSDLCPGDAVLMSKHI